MRDGIPRQVDGRGVFFRSAHGAGADRPIRGGPRAQGRARRRAGAMSLAEQITALILTHNEEDNIGRTLAALRWVPRILVVDSGSSDATLAIVRRYPQVEV